MGYLIYLVLLKLYRFLIFAIDNVNQRDKFWWDANSYPIDRVGSFNIDQIEKALKGAKTLAQRDNLFNQNPSVCDYDLLIELFDNNINLK